MTDLSTTWQSTGMAAQQRAIVDRQLTDMFAGKAPPHFALIGTWLRELTRAHSITLLDAGCSSGYYFDVAEFYAYRRVRYTGVDYNPEMIDLARRYNPGVHFDLADMRHLPYADQEFDAVLTGAAVNHIPDWPAALTELQRVCRRYFILHRAWIHDAPSKSTVEEAYGQRHCQWHWQLADVQAALGDFALRQEAEAEGALSCGCRSMSYLWERRR